MEDTVLKKAIEKQQRIADDIAYHYADFGKLPQERRTIANFDKYQKILDDLKSEFDVLSVEIKNHKDCDKTNYAKFEDSTKAVYDKFISKLINFRATEKAKNSKKNRNNNTTNSVSRANSATNIATHNDKRR